jgi:hypothetical protein
VSAQSAPLAFPVHFDAAEIYHDLSGNPASIKPYGLAIADVVGPGPSYLPDGLPDVAVAYYDTDAAIEDCYGTIDCRGRVVIFRNLGNWANDGQNLGLDVFARIDFPIWRPPPLNPFARPPYDLRWVDIDRDPLGTLDLVVSTGGHDVNDVLIPPAAVWVIRNNCTSEQTAKFELLFDEHGTWPYPIEFNGVDYPGIGVAELTGDTLPDVTCGGGDSVAGRAAVQVFENLGDLALDQAVVWTNPGVTASWGTAVVARRVRFDAGPPEGDVMMSLWPFGFQDATLFLHNDGGGSFTTSVDDGRAGYGLALQRFLPCQLGLVATFDTTGTPNAWARVMYLDDDGKITNSPLPANYRLTYTQNRPKEAWGVATGRFDTDDRWDFVVAFGNGGPASHHSGGVAVFRNDPLNSGAFITTPVFFDTHPGATAPDPGPTFVAVADMDGDRRDDLVVSNTGSDTIAVLINLN